MRACGTALTCWCATGEGGASWRCCSPMTGRTPSLGLPGAAGGCTVKSPLLLGKAGYAGRSTRAALGPALVSTVIERFVCRPSSNARRRGGGVAACERCMRAVAPHLETWQHPPETRSWPHNLGATCQRHTQAGAPTGPDANRTTHAVNFEGLREAGAAGRLLTRLVLGHCGRQERVSRGGANRCGGEGMAAGTGSASLAGMRVIVLRLTPRRAHLVQDAVAASAAPDRLPRLDVVQGVAVCGFNSSGTGG